MIDAKGTYRLRGKRGSVSYFKMAQLRDMIRTNQPSGALAYADFKDLKLDSDGTFDVILSAERPANYTGDWWKLEPATEKQMVRQVARSEEHTSELQSLMRISYTVSCFKKKIKQHHIP